MMFLLASCVRWDDLSSPAEPTDPREAGPLPEPCPRKPCVTDVATASYEAAFGWNSNVGYSLAVAGDQLIVGAPFFLIGYGVGSSRVLSLSARELTMSESWVGASSNGMAVAAGDIGLDGVIDIAIGAPLSFDTVEDDSGGKVYLVEGGVGGEQYIRDAARHTIVGNDEMRLGYDLLFSEDGRELTLNGTDKRGEQGRVHVFAVDEPGTSHEDDALRSITSPFAIGAVGHWDGDGDGLQDLLVQDYLLDAITFFAAPWSSGTLEDADVRWEGDCSGECLFGNELEDIGDVTGDGSADLGSAAPQWSTPAERAGRAYVLPSIGEGGTAEDIAIQVHGEKLGDGMGFALAGGDIDGDGQQDFVVSASGVSPSSRPGNLLVYRGPLADGVRTMDDADGVVRGEYSFDLFVRAIAVLDADGDGRDDLAVGAPGWPAGRARGAVYLLTGADLLP